MSKSESSKEKELILTISLCNNKSINGEYRNKLPSNDDQQTLPDFMNKNLNKLLMDDNNNNNYYINEAHIFTHKLFDNNTKHDYILFLAQHKLSLLKNTWYIAKYNGIGQNIEILYYVNDKISSRHYFAPKIKWKPYNNKSKTIIHINTFNTKEINLDKHLFVSNNQYTDTNNWARDNLDRIVLKKYKRNRYCNEIKWKESDFDNIYFKPIRFSSISDVEWFSGAHSWYKHLPLTGGNYMIYPDYNAMTRGYGGGPRHEKHIRWHMSPIQKDISKSIQINLFQKDVSKIISKYCENGKIQFNSAYCGVRRCLAHGNNEYGQNRYPNSKIFQSEHSFTLIESEQQIENAVRCAFMIYEEIIELFNYWKYCVLNYWLRMNKIEYIVKEIKNIIHKFILLEYEHYAFIKPYIFKWDTYKTKRYFKRLYCGLKMDGFSEEGIQSIDKLWNDHWIYGADLIKLNEEYLIKAKMSNKKDRILFLKQIENFYNGHTLVEYIKYISSKYKDFKMENINEMQIIINLESLNLKEFKEKGNDADFYQNLNIKNEQVIKTLIKIHQFVTKPLREKKANDWY